MHIPVQDLTSTAFAPYGQVIERPQRANDGSGPGWQWWGEMMTMAGGERPYAIGYLDLQPAPAQFDWAERHMTTDELIAPLTGDCLVYVAPAEYPEQPERLPELDRFAVFRVKAGQAVLLHKGVWHGAPLAGSTPAQVLVILQQSTSNVDGYVQRFEDRPIQVG